MKAINKIIILGMVTTLFSSCDLTLLPENAVTPENYFQNKSDLELGPINFILCWMNRTLQPVQMQTI